MNIQQMMRQAKKMQEQMDKAKSQLSTQEFKVEKAGVSLTMLGNRKVIGININPALIDPDDKETLEDLMTLVVNEANELIDKAESLIQPHQTGSMF